MRRIVRTDVDRRDDFADVARLLQQSTLVRGVESVVRVLDSAVQRSRVVAVVRARIDAIVHLSLEERIRCLAMFSFAAASTELLLSGFIPARSAPALPLGVRVVAASLAAVPLFAPRAVLAAWHNWKRRRVARPF